MVVSLHNPDDQYFLFLAIPFLKLRVVITVLPTDQSEIILLTAVTTKVAFALLQFYKVKEFISIVERKNSSFSFGKFFHLFNF